MTLKVAILITLVAGLLADPREDLIQGTRNFTGSLYKGLIGTYPNQNVIFSSLTVQTLMSVLMSAARNENDAVVRELRDALSLPYGNAQREAAFKEILQDLNGADNDFKVLDATKMYFKTNYTVQPWYQSTAQNVYRTEIEVVNFGNKWNTTQNINQWVAQKTNNKITNFVDFYDITPRIRILLINTLYLSGKWTKPFLNETNTWETFYGPNGAKQVEMMNNNKSYDYYEDTNAQYLKLEMLREGGGAEMVFVLPKQRQGLAQLESSIQDFLQPVSFKPAIVNVTLPKFSFSNNLNLKPILQNLGVTKLFVFGAQLQGLRYDRHPYTQVTDVLQSSFIDVNEWGVTAASGTGVSGIVDALRRHESFKADHPFLFYITVDEAIVYAGRVMQV